MAYLSLEWVHNGVIYCASSSAHDVAALKQHKSISASDVLKALETAQFGDIIDKLQDELKGIFSFIVNHKHFITL